MYQKSALWPRGLPQKRHEKGNLIHGKSSGIMAHGVISMQPSRLKLRSGLLAFTICISLVCCQLGRSTVPDALVGVWKTSAPRYRNSYFELTKSLIIFGSGRFFDYMDVNFIVKVQEKPKQTHILYTIHYENMDCHFCT